MVLRDAKDIGLVEEVAAAHAKVHQGGRVAAVAGGFAHKLLRPLAGCALHLKGLLQFVQGVLQNGCVEVQRRLARLVLADIGMDHLAQDLLLLLVKEEIGFRTFAGYLLVEAQHGVKQLQVGGGVGLLPHEFLPMLPLDVGGPHAKGDGIAAVVPFAVFKRFPSCGVHGVNARDQLRVIQRRGIALLYHGAQRGIQRQNKQVGLRIPVADQLPRVRGADIGSIQKQCGVRQLLPEQLHGAPADILGLDGEGIAQIHRPPGLPDGQLAAKEHPIGAARQHKTLRMPRYHHVKGQQGGEGKLPLLV